LSDGGVDVGVRIGVDEDEDTGDRKTVRAGGVEEEELVTVDVEEGKNVGVGVEEEEIVRADVEEETGEIGVWVGVEAASSS
jgi:hypothetical protein